MAWCSRKIRSRSGAEGLAASMVAAISVFILSGSSDIRDGRRTQELAAAVEHSAGGIKESAFAGSARGQFKRCIAVRGTVIRLVMDPSNKKSPTPVKAWGIKFYCNLSRRMTDR